MLYRLVDYLLYSVDIAGEGRDDYALALCRVEKPLEALADAAFALCVARSLNVRAFAHQREHTPVPKLAEAREVDYPALDRGIVNLEVARMHDNSRGGVYSKRAGVGNGVVYADKFNGHTAHADILPRLDNVQRSLRQQTVLLELALDKPEREPCSVYGNIYLLEQIRQRADMILVSVSDDNAPELIPVLFEIGEVGDNEVNARHFLIGERKAAVYDKHIVAAFVNVKVLSYLVKTAERDELNGRGAHLARLLLYKSALARLLLRENGLFFLYRAALRRVPAVFFHGNICLFRHAVRVIFLCGSRRTLLGIVFLLLPAILGSDILCFCQKLAVGQ